MGVDPFCERLVIADDNDAIAEVFQFLAFALVLFFSGRLVVRSAVDEDRYTLQSLKSFPKSIEDEPQRRFYFWIE